jgi:hypothetical protein
MDMDQSFDVLVFGFLPCSHGNLRERVCDVIEASNRLKILCLHQVFGEVLDFFIARSRVVLNVPYFKDASLATHRIDPLLLGGKAVASFRSSDSHLDSLYAPVVTFFEASDFGLLKDGSSEQILNHSSDRSDDVLRDSRASLEQTMLRLYTAAACDESVLELNLSGIEKISEEKDKASAFCDKNSYNRAINRYYIEHVLRNITPLCLAIHEFFLQELE